MGLHAARGLILAVACAGAGCGSNAAADDTGTDVGDDTAEDAATGDAVTPDAEPGDATADADPVDADTTADADPVDAGDTGTDAPPDVGADVGADVMADAPRPPDVSIDADSDPPGPFDAGVPCTPDRATTDFGVTIEIALDDCAFTRAELAAGVALPFRVVVAGASEPIWSRPLDAGGCDSADGSRLRTLPRVSGDDQSWCVCDTGLCMAPTPTFLIPPAGTYADEIVWDGRNWFGPSDFGNPPGEPFPPGAYTFSVRAAGQVQRADGAVEEWDITAAVPIVVLD